MDRNGDLIMTDDDGSQANVQYVGGDEQPPILTCTFFLDHVGEVFLTLKPDGLSWKLMESLCNDQVDRSTCLGIPILSKHDTSIKISDVYAVEFIDWGLVHDTLLTNPGFLLGHASEMYRFTVHGVARSKSQSSLWAPVVYTFGHVDKQTCQTWVNKINSFLSLETDRPKSLLVYVNPGSGKGNGCRTWESVAPIFSQAKVKTKVIVTERAGHAFEAMASITNLELNMYDGVVAVGGDGFFNEILNGILLTRHRAPYPPSPPNDDPTVQNESDVLLHDPTVTIVDSTVSNDDESPLLKRSKLNESQAISLNLDSEMSFPNERFRFGLIPSGSTDAIVMCTTGVRDPMTSALQIILGKRVCLDIVQVVRWDKSHASKNEPHVRYAASFAGYGFYGDVITESEKYRWMGPKRYDYAGTKVFLRHRSYEAKVAYMKAESEKTNVGANARRIKAFWGLSKESERVACRAKCDICNDASAGQQIEKPDPKQESNWVSVKGRFLSIGAAVISCRNEKAPDGLVAEAHLSDGFLHLVLIKECPRAFYLWHLTQLARKGGTPLNFDFVEHHKTTTFTFTSSGEESVWNVDGEILQAQKLSAQVFRGLISLFASGPET
ncbi:putative ceramide kinase [Helianthus annuus]|uniref:Ceramide kinase n=1 Tax=Helianthus annuus TaxID=4232 RepID=A0A251SLX7_HELAN|nr:ceramide kinase isoform X1 [Helianthus annuus]KAF5771245.1 putative ceramide kinase [Helianthus annuus]KAJ0487666.1 putative ceramide kinase [Helianthus annuus]